MKSFKEYINEAHDIEDMASGVHDEWMRRNPKEDYNAAQHVDYSKLPDHEKQKDREHINLALKLRKDNPRDPETDVKDHEERLAQRFGAIQHQSWRKGHESAKGVGAPRMKKVSDGPDVDINVPWEKLHPEWKRENLEAGRAAVGITGILKPREMNEAKLQYRGKPLDADKLSRPGGPTRGASRAVKTLKKQNKALRKEGNHPMYEDSGERAGGPEDGNTGYGLSRKNRRFYPAKNPRPTGPGTEYHMETLRQKYEAKKAAEAAAAAAEAAKSAGEQEPEHWRDFPTDVRYDQYGDQD